MEDGFRSDPFSALEYYNRVVEVLEWGRRVWKNETTEDRGIIFQDTFLRGVKCLRLDTLMKVCPLSLNEYDSLADS